MLAMEVYCQGMHSLGVVVVLKHHGVAYSDCAVHSCLIYPPTPPLPWWFS